MAIQRVKSVSTDTFMGDGTTMGLVVALPDTPTNIVNVTTSGAFGVAGATTAGNLLTVMFTVAPPTGVANSFNLTVTYNY